MRFLFGKSCGNRWGRNFGLHIDMVDVGQGGLGAGILQNYDEFYIFIYILRLRIRFGYIWM